MVWTQRQEVPLIKADGRRFPKQEPLRSFHDTVQEFTVHRLTPDQNSLAENSSSSLKLAQDVVWWMLTLVIPAEGFILGKLLDFVTNANAIGEKIHEAWYYN